MIVNQRESVVPLFPVDLPSPVQEVTIALMKEKGVRLLVKRDDLIHPHVSGNKYRKLKYNLLEALRLHASPVITFGGAFSNHLYATAASCHLLKLPCIGFVRGEDDRNNPTLRFCRENGMELYFLDRQSYRLKQQSPQVEAFLQKYPGHYLIPEGGTNTLALQGVKEIWEEVSGQLEFMPDVVVLSAGTGGTAAGLLASAPNKGKLLVIPALKSQHFHDEIRKLAGTPKGEELFDIASEYSFGGYGKYNHSLLAFIEEFQVSTAIPLDPIYTAKAMYGLLDLVRQDHFAPGSTLLFLHTGGLQGKNGLQYMLKKEG